MALKLEDVIFEGLSRLSAEERNLQSAEGGRHPSATVLEELAERKQWNPKELIHTNTCAWCRTTIRLIREELEIKPWWEESQGAARRALAALIPPMSPDALRFAIAGRHQEVRAGSNVGLGSIPERYRVPSVVMHSEQELEPAEVAVVTHNFTPDRSLWLSVRLTNQLRSLEQSPVEMTVVSYPDGQLLDTFLLPKLSGGQAEEVELELPPELLTVWQDIEARPPEQLPLRFILRPYANNIEGDAER